MWYDQGPCVMSYMDEGYPVTVYMNASAEMVVALKKDPLVKTYVNRAENNGEPISIPRRIVTPASGNPMEAGYVPEVTEVIPRTEWLVIQKAANDAREAAQKAERIAARKLVRQAAAQALKDAKTGNFLGLDPKTDRIIITTTVATTLNQLGAGGLTSEGEPA